MELLEIMLKTMEFLDLQNISQLIILLVSLTFSLIPALEKYSQLFTMSKRQKLIKEYVITEIIKKISKSNYQSIIQFNENVKKEDKKLNKFIRAYFLFLICLYFSIYFIFKNVIDFIFPFLTNLFAISTLILLAILFILISLKDKIESFVTTLSALTSIKLLNYIDLITRIFGIFNTLFFIILYSKLHESIHISLALYIGFLLLPFIYTIPISLLRDFILSLRKKVIRKEIDKVFESLSKAKNKKVRKSDINIVVIFTKNKYRFKGKVTSISNDDYLEIETKGGKRIPIFWNEILYVKI